MPAPIVLFAYNRPEHTKRTIDALLANPLAAHSELYIFCDGPKNDAAVAAVNEVREICSSVTGFARTELVLSDHNRGLAASIIDGVSTVVNKHGRVIVMEDDLVTSPNFLAYMNDALDRYAGEERVMHVSGATYPVNVEGLPANFFLKIPLCWGWATWDRAWKHFKKDLSLMDAFSPELKRRFNFDGSHDYWGQLERNKSGAINTWFIFWYATLALRGGVSLFSRDSLVQNIGFDGTGVHCGTSTTYTATANDAAPNLSEGIAIEEHQGAYIRHVRFFNSVSHSRKRRWLEKLRRVAAQCFGLG